MTALILSLLLSALFLFILFAIASSCRRPIAPPAQPTGVDLADLLALSAIFYPRVDLLFDRTDFDYLQKIGAHAAARDLRQDRRHAALLWLRGLRRDVGSLLLFHRSLARVGVENPLRTDLWLSFNLGLFYILYGAVSLSVWIAGPYWLPQVRQALANNTRFILRLLEILSSRLPAPLPDAVRAELAAARGMDRH